MARKSISLFRKGRTGAIAVRRGSYKSLFLPNSGRSSPRKNREFSSELWVRVNGLNRYGPSPFTL